VPPKAEESNKVIIIGELINGSRDSVKQAIASRDKKYIADLTVREDEAGADFIDCNPGTIGEQESNDMQWLVETIQVATDKPISFDSPNPQAIRRGLATYSGEAMPMINSVTLEPGSVEKMLPIVLEAKVNVVALALGEGGMPTQPGQREQVAQQIIDRLTAGGIEPEQIFVDPVIAPLSTATEVSQHIFQAIAAIRDYGPKCHITCGLSNISFGLPNRQLMNRAFIGPAMQAGMDSAVMDPLDEQLMAQVIATEALLGEDEFCMNYLQAYRAGKLDV